MNAAFFHDAPLFFNGDNDVYSIGFSYDIWKSYLEVFDTITVATRRSEVNNIDLSRLKLSSGPNVYFSPINSYSVKSDIFLRIKKLSIRYMVY